MDELFTFIKDKKNLRHYHSRSQNLLYFGLKVVWERTKEAIQLMVDDAQKAKLYFSDGFDTYAALWYDGGRYEVSQAKNDT